MSRTEHNSELAGTGERDGIADTAARPQRLWERLQWFFTRWKKLSAFLSTVSPFILIYLIWYFVAHWELYPAYLLPSPNAVLRVTMETISNGVLLDNVAASMNRVLLGFLAGVGIGLPLGVLMGMSRVVSRFVMPVVVFLQAIPGLAWIPLAILWFGIGYKFVTFIVFLSVFTPILFNTMMGIRSVDETVIHAALTLGANRRVLVTEILLPGALASILTGIRLGAGYGWRALVAAEMIGASSGLGFMIFDARQYLRSDVVILGMLALGATWLLVESVFLKPLEVRTIERWGAVR